MFYREILEQFLLTPQLVSKWIDETLTETLSIYMNENDIKNFLQILKCRTDLLVSMWRCEHMEDYFDPDNSYRPRRIHVSIEAENR